MICLLRQGLGSPFGASRLKKGKTFSVVAEKKLTFSDDIKKIQTP
jgi:hypothetical protein